MTENRLVLVRHCQSQPSEAVSHVNWPLSEKGRLQAVELIPQLEGEGVEVIYSSPYERAVDTITPFSRDLGLEIHLDRELRERKLADGFIDNFDEVI